MQKFVELELAKRLGKRAGDDLLDEAEIRRRREDADLYSVPDEFKTTLQQDVPIAGLMTGITEVALPVEERLKKFEETEAAKRRMLAAASRRARLPLDDEDRRPAQEGGKMRRGLFAATFGKHQPVRMAERDPEELEAQRRRVVSERRPIHKPGKAAGGR
mmetsp:Transcript_18633/g.40036  ORF Transcript_18633/g.40036 Transcript_18633/m.40036 type:complete len:160 (+) Transcript_18633:394-873(+)